MSVTEKCLEAPLQAEAVAPAGVTAGQRQRVSPRAGGFSAEGLVLILAELGELAGVLVPKRSLYHEVVVEGLTVSLGDVSEVSTFQVTSEGNRRTPSSHAWSWGPNPAHPPHAPVIRLSCSKNRTEYSAPSQAPWPQVLRDGGALLLGISRREGQGQEGEVSASEFRGSRQNLPASSPCGFPGAPREGLLGPVSEQGIPGSQL